VGLKILGLDHGKKRVGVAVSDVAQIHAFPLEVVPGQDRHKLLSRLAAIVEDQGVGIVVVGLPLTMLGEIGPQAEKVKEFVARLRHKLGDKVAVEMWDERLSSAQADRGRGCATRRQLKDGTRDMMAAVVILQSFLDRKE
jgi:putative pre-16S rRNA nuclease